MVTLRGALRRIPAYAKTFLQNPRKGINLFLNDLDTIRRPAKCWGYPTFVDIAITDSCNLGCIMCPRTVDPTIELDELETERLIGIIDEVSDFATKIQLSGGLGEPLLYEDLFEVIEYAKNQGLKVHLTSNGTLLNQETATKLLNSGLDYLSLSIDGAEKETYESIRKGGSFEEVIQGVKKLVNLRDKRGFNLTIEITPVILANYNLQELPEFVDLAKELGVDGIGFTELKYSIDSNSFSSTAIRDLPVDKKERVRLIYDKTKNRARELDVDIRLPDDKDQLCRQPWKMLTLTTKGQVRPCCTGPYENFVGDLLKQDLDTVWNNSNLTAWRRDMKSTTPPEACLKCPLEPK